MVPTPPVAMHTPKGPDGTRGFTFGRGRGLAPPAGLPSRASSGKLDPTAPVFVPSGLSEALSGRLSGEGGASDGGDALAAGTS